MKTYYENTTGITAHCDDSSVIAITDEGVSILNGAKERSKDLPTEYYDLANKNYNAIIEELTTLHWLYTNYFFYSGSNGTIYVKYKVCKHGGVNVKMRIGIFDLTADTSYTDFLTSNLANVGDYTEGQMHFSGLNPTHQYAVGFRAYTDDGQSHTITGGARIGQSFVNGDVTT